MTKNLDLLKDEPLELAVALRKLSESGRGGRRGRQGVGCIRAGDAGVGAEAAGRESA